MKEVTYEDWQKNPIPRMMWVWNDDVENKEKMKVTYVLNNGRGRTYRVLSIVDEDYAFETFKHCAEIEKQRRMTHKELSRWIREHPSREYKQDEEVHKDIRIREDGGEWREPLVEVSGMTDFTK